SPVSLSVSALSIKLVMYLAKGNVNETALNHELWQIKSYYETLREFEQRAARDIRLRLMEARRKAANEPDKWEEFIGAKAIVTMVRAGMAPFFADSIPIEAHVRGAVISLTDLSTRPALPPELEPPPALIKGRGMELWKKLK